MEGKEKGNEEEGAQEEGASFRRMDQLLAFLVIASIMALQLLICHLSDYRNPKKERGSERNRNSDDGSQHKTTWDAAEKHSGPKKSLKYKIRN